MADRSEPLRPLMVVPDFDRIGGYERQAFSMARHGSRAGLGGLLLTNNPFDLPPREHRDGVTIHRLDARLMREFLVFLDAHRDDFDVIHCHAMTFLSAACVALGKVLRKPVVVKVATERDIREFREARSLGFRFFWFWLRRADRLLCLTEAIEEEALRCGFRPERLALVPNGVDLEEFAPQGRTDRTGGACTFIYVGRLVERKAVDVLLRAFALLEGACGARLTLVGDGEERGALEQLAAQLGITERVTFAGEVPDVRPFLAGADVFVFPSRLEGLPNALLEAMSMGLPAIATRIGGCVDVIGEDAGLLVAVDDPDGLADQMRRLAGDAGLREALGRRARARVAGHFGFASILARLQEVYRAVARH